MAFMKMERMEGETPGGREWGDLAGVNMVVIEMGGEGGGGGMISGSGRDGDDGRDGRGDKRWWCGGGGGCGCGHVMVVM